MLRRIVFATILSGTLCWPLAGCKTTPEQAKTAKAAKTGKPKPVPTTLADQNGDQAFLSFLSRLRKVIAAHDVETLASMMTTSFGYSLEPEPNGLSGPGVFAYWDEHNLWPELQMVVNERFVPSGDKFMVAPGEFAANPETYAGYRAGVESVQGAWKFSYFVNGPGQ